MTHFTLNTQNRTYQPQNLDFKNPFRDKLEGTEYIEVQNRLERYTKTYDNTEYDQNPEIGVVDVFDSSGDSAVGSNMMFHGNLSLGAFSETRYNSNRAGDRFHVTKLSFSNQADKVVVVQSRDQDGDKYEEFLRETTIDRASQRIENVVER